MLVNIVDPILPVAEFEKPYFSVRVKEHSFATSIVNKSNKKVNEPEDQIIFRPTVSLVKDLITENIDGDSIVFCAAATDIVSPNKHARTVVGTPVVSVKIGDLHYYGLYDLGSSASAIPFYLYQEVMNEITPCEIEDIDVTILLANRKTISPVGIVRDVEVLCGKVKYPTEFLILGSVEDKSCPIIFGRPFLNTCGCRYRFQ